MQTAHLLRFRAKRKAAAATKQPLINTDFTEKKKTVKSVAKKTAPKKSVKSVKSVAPKKAAAKKSEKSVKSVAPKKTAAKKTAPKKRTK